MKPLKPNELRVKNIVQVGNGIEMRVVAVHDDGTVYCDFDGNKGGLWEFDDKDPCYGVKLTEEKLLEWGFEKCIGKYGVYYKHKEASLMRIWQHEGCGWVLGKKIPDIETTVIVSQVFFYLHQTQNLFFTLTDEELTKS